jgi:hypothetical protein
MPRPHIVWDTRNETHLGERGRCHVEEVQEVIRGTCHTSRRERLPVPAGDPTKWQYFGETCGGRFLVVIAEAAAHGIRPITCWPLSGRELARYLAWRRTRKAR